MMMRQQTVVGSPEDSSSSPQHGSPRRSALSPRSISSDSSFHTGGNGSLSYAGSVIGHDDPTLVHTNVKGNIRHRSDDKTVHSEALDSFLTVSFSEEERQESSGDEERRSVQSLTDEEPRQELKRQDSSGDEQRRSVQIFADEELRKELVELDRAQDAWRIKQQVGSGDMDDTGDFYVKEAGGFTPSSPRRKKLTFVPNKGIIYEEVGKRQETIYEEEELKEKVESHSMQPQRSEIRADTTASQSQQRKMEMVIKATSPRRRQREQQGVVANTLLNLPPRQYQRTDDMANTSYDQLPQQYQSEKGMPGIHDQSDQRRTQQGVASSISKELHLQQTQEKIANTVTDQQQNVDQSNDSKKIDPGAVDVEILMASFATSPTQSEDSELDFEYPSTDGDQSVVSKKNESCTTVVDDAEPCDRAKDRNIVDIEDNIMYSNTLTNAEPEDNESIIKAVQARLYDFSSNNRSEVPYGTDHPEQLPTKSGLFAAKSNNTPWKSKINIWSRSQALASQVDASNDEDDVDFDVHSGFDPRRLKFCIMNCCLAFVIIVAIVCAVLLGVELKGTRNNGSSSVMESNENQETTQPTASPIESVRIGISDAIIISGKKIEDKSSSVYPKPPVQIPTEEPSRHSQAPMLDSNAVEEKLHMIAGDGIYNTSTPQYAAYDWLLSKDPANLDFGSSTEEEVNQRYIAAVFYFAMNGGDWIEQYGFLEDSHVCDWNDGSNRNTMGITCDSSNKITGFAINENNLRGQLPGELQELTGMTFFN